MWHSPLASEWIEADRFPLARLAWMIDCAARGKLNGALAREMRHIADAFGLTPYGRRRPGWWIGEGEVVKLAPVPGPRRVRAVDSDGAT